MVLRNSDYAFTLMITLITLMITLKYIILFMITIITVMYIHARAYAFCMCVHSVYVSRAYNARAKSVIIVIMM